jgi:integrase/recombinase XerD
MNNDQTLALVSAEIPQLLQNVGTEYRSAEDQQLVAMFLAGRAAATTRKYERDLQSFFQFIGDRSFRSVNLETLQQWSSSLSGAPKSVRERIATVRSFFAWSTKLGALRLNPAAMLSVPNVREALHERLLTDDERIAILDATLSQRDRMLVAFLFVSGCRVSELVALRVKDLRFDVDGSVAVTLTRQKTNDTTTQRYSAQSSVAQGLRELVDGCTPDDYVFRSTGVPTTITTRAAANKGGKLDTSAVWRVVRAAAKRAGVQKRVSPHWLRHACATRLVQREQNLHSVSQWLGHSSIQTTMRYVHVVGSLDLSHHFDD